MTTLYRKYRPQQFSDVADQAHIIKTITNEVAAGTTAHAYLFSGPRGVGKTTTARLLAKAVNCEKRKTDEGEPCNSCKSCEEITIGRSIDVIEIDAASQTGVDNVRENIIENAQFKPTKSKYKVFIIDEVHMLSTSAFNALLKTLEEPPAHIIFILATTELHKLPATVISRCQRFTFKKIGYDQMLERLKKIIGEEKVKVDDEVLGRIISKSEGGLRDAESLLGQILALGLKKISVEDIQTILPTTNIESIIEFLGHIKNNDTGAAISCINNLYNHGTNIDQFAYDALETLRVMLVIGTTHDNTPFKAEYASDTLKNLQTLSDEFGAQRLMLLIDRLMKRRLEIKTTPFPQLPLELFAVETTTTAPVSSTQPTASDNNNHPKTPTLTPSAPAPVTKPVTPPSPVEKTIIAEPVSPVPAPTNTTPTPTTTPTATPAPATRTSAGPITITLSVIKEKWNSIVEKISESNHSLTFILKMCGLKNVDERGLTLTVPYAFHKEKLEEMKSKRALEDYIEALCGERIPVLCELEAIPTTTPTNTEIDSLANAFGGEVVG